MANEDWVPDNSLYGKESNQPCPPCTLCGQPMWYMITLFGNAKMHKGTDEFLCAEPITKKENHADGA